MLDWYTRRSSRWIQTACVALGLTLHLTTSTSAQRLTTFTHFKNQVNAQYAALLNDSSVTFDQVQPLFEQWWDRQHQQALRRKRAKPNTDYVILVTTDGFRWQELFGGADSLLIRNTNYVKDTADLAQRFWAPSADERRQRLLPFFWSTFGQDGQVYGNRHLNNQVNVANHKWFSYPGYNELLTGAPDDTHILTNLKVPNPNTNVLEFLNTRRGLRGRVAAFSTWDVFPYILNTGRSHLPVVIGESAPTAFAPAYASALAPAAKPSAGLQPDEPTMAVALNYLKIKHPRVLFVSFDDTDHEAHLGHYDRYLEAAHRFDQWLAELWQWVQTHPKYRDHTTLLVTTDHGRGLGNDWRNHSFLVPHSDEIWLAAIGPDTEPLGEIRQPAQVWQEQVAQTVAALLGEHFQCEHRVAPPVAGILKQVEQRLKMAQVAENR